MVPNPSSVSVSNRPEFIWDEGNIKHIILDYPGRNNTVTEVEHIFTDIDFTGDFDRLDPKTGEPRYWGMGLGTENVIKYVVYVVRNGKIRPVTCYTAKRKQRDLYHEQANTSRGEKAQTSG